MKLRNTWIFLFLEQNWKLLLVLFLSAPVWITIIGTCLGALLALYAVWIGAMANLFGIDFMATWMSDFLAWLHSYNDKLLGKKQ